MSQPLVSILMPTYEPNPLHLQAAIDCVLTQTETRWTLLIHDDASGVDVAALVKPYLTDTRITFIRSEKRFGIGGNWNACLQKAAAPFVQFLFQDDLWEDDYLATAAESLESDPSVGLVSVDHAYFFEGDIDTAFREGYDTLLETKRKEISAGHHDGRAFLRWWMARGLRPNVIGEPSFVMMRHASLEAAGTFLEDMPQFLDAEMWTRLLRVSDCAFVKTSHGSFRVHPSGASTRNQSSGIGLFDRLRCMERVMHAAEGSDRSSAKHAIALQLAGMIQKFRNRQTTGQSVTMHGSGALKTFILRHPFLMMRGLWMARTGDKLR